MDILSLGVLGDILGFNNGNIKKMRIRITKKQFGDNYINEGKNYASTQFFTFLANGGVNQNINNLKYSFNTLMLMATLKGCQNNKDNLTKSCANEYIRMYKKVGQKNLNNTYFINNNYLNSLESLNKNESIQYNNIYNDSMVLSRIVPIALLFWKKEDRTKLITEIINNISLTHKNTTTYLAGITLGLFVSYSRYNIEVDKWADKLTDYLLSSEFDTIIKDIKLYSTEFLIEKEDYISMWNEYLNSVFFKNRRELIFKNLIPSNRANNLFLRFNELNAEEFVYGIKADQALIIAYESLLMSNGNWQNILLFGMIGVTDNSVMGMLSGILFGLVYKYNTVNEIQFMNEPWREKIVNLSKDLNFN